MSSVGEVLKDDLIVFAVHFKAMLKKNWLVSVRLKKNPLLMFHTETIVQNDNRPTSRTNFIPYPFIWTQ